jgi:hypothetical protein
VRAFWAVFLAGCDGIRGCRHTRHKPRFRWSVPVWCRHIGCDGKTACAARCDGILAVLSQRTVPGSLGRGEQVGYEVAADLPRAT